MLLRAYNLKTVANDGFSLQAQLLTLWQATLPHLPIPYLIFRALGGPLSMLDFGTRTV